jgi:hypothetical protein
VLAAGAEFPIREFPAKGCDDRHYITIRTDTPDSKLPPEGTRISPAWAGVASLRDRPAYAQPTGGPAKLLATIVVVPLPGVTFGDHYRFIGLEWKPAEGKQIRHLALTSGADHIIFDRNWMHGSDGEELKTGVGMNDGSHYIAVIHSYLSSFMCIAKTGACTDADAIGGGNGEKPVQTLKIVDNFVESSGQNIFFGGAPSAVRPEDIEIRRNHLYKPMFWNPNTSEHLEPVPIAKNLFELKNGNRVLFEANYLENSWAGFTQNGAAILLTPRNNYNKRVDEVKCPNCAVTNITIRYVWVRKANQVFFIGNPLDKDKPAAANSYSIHDVVAEGIGYPECGKGCNGALNLLSSGHGDVPAETVLHDVSADHLTFASMRPPRALFSLGGPPAKGPDSPKIYNISWTNTVADAGSYGAWSKGGKPGTNCSDVGRASPKLRLDACWKNWTFAGNVLGGVGKLRGQESAWPDGNYYADSQEAIGFVKLNGGLDGDYHLAPSSKFKGKGTDGKDPGADIDAVTKAIAGVR